MIRLDVKDYCHNCRSDQFAEYERYGRQMRVQRQM